VFEQQRNVVDALRDDVGYLMHAQSLAQSGIWFSGIYRGMKLSYYQLVTSTY
jgi:hypothetical protein